MRWPISLRGRLALGTFSALAAVAGALTWYYGHSMNRLLSQESDRRLATLTGQLAAFNRNDVVVGIREHSERHLRGLLDGAMSLDEVAAVAIFDASGKFVAGRARPGREVPAFQSTESCAPFPPGIRCSAPVGNPSGPAEVEPAAFYEDGPPPGAGGGWLVLDVTTDARTRAEREITATAAVLAATALLIALVLTWFLARRLTRPLQELGEATHAIGQGQFDVSLPRGAYAEFGSLVDDFRAMAHRLAEARDDLEGKVADRTRELRKANGELEDANRAMKVMADAKDQFVATVSHDFRSPLAIVLSSVQTVLADESMPPEVRARFLARAERHCKRLGALVSDLLDLARIENREGVFGRASLREVAEEQLEGARQAFEEKGVALVAELGAEPVEAEVDRALVGRALTNLVDNALKFTPPRGSVKVALARTDGVARLAVEDTGPGIPAEERERVFERFFQGRAGLALGRGSGLGLAIVEGVARRHGGAVSVGEAPGGGARFELVLPVARAEGR